MSWGNRACVSCAAAFLVLVFGVPASATAKPPPITGKLNKSGYTVIALADNGRAATVKVKVKVRRHAFRVRSLAGQVTLHLRAPDGTYAGPIVVGRENHGKRAIVGVRAGAKLGKVTIRRGKGYATAEPVAKSIVATRWARAKGGVPIGDGRNVGLVRSRNAHGKGSDPDLDGVPSSLDVDDDGDLILDTYDHSTAKTKKAGMRGLLSALRPLAATETGPPMLNLNTHLWVAGPEAVNVNAGSSAEQIAAAQQAMSMVSMIWSGVDDGSAEIDCGALAYCSAGGTGRYQPTGFTQPPESPPFPACCDPDGDGLGTLTDTQPTSPDHHGMSLWAGATTDQLRAGDILIERAAKDGSPVELASSLGFVFSTFPVLAAYDDGQGDSATFGYPRANRLVPLRAGPNGEVVVGLTFWRPQRRRIEDEPGAGEWMDVGHLDYTTTAVPLGGVNAGVCPLSSFSGIDPNLAPQEPAAPLPGAPRTYLEDLEGDQPSSPANTFSFTLNVTHCLASNGLSMSTTQPTNFVFTAYTVQPPNLGTAAFSVNFQLQP